MDTKNASTKKFGWAGELPPRFDDRLVADEDYRGRVRSDPRGVLADEGVDIPPGVDLRFVQNTDETYYLALPPDPNEYLADENLALVSGGRPATGDRASTASSAGTLATVPSCVSSALTFGSVFV